MTSKICLELDCLSAAQAYRLTRTLGPQCYAVKIRGLLYSQGGRIIGGLSNAGRTKVFVDVKIHDIPGAAAENAMEIACHGAHIISVHAGGGIPMMKAVVNRLNKSFGPAAVSVWAVTLLTSLGPTEIERDFGKYGKNPTAKQIVLNRALMAKEAGVKCVICSPQEVRMLSKHPGLKGMKFVTPGVRSLGANIGDQKRIGTPKQALDDGASLIVVGSQVTEAEDPVAAFNAIMEEIGMDITQ